MPPTDRSPFPPMTRRDLLGSVAVAAGLGVARSTSASERSWRCGAVRHLLPTASHERFLMKVSCVRPLAAPPSLSIGQRRVRGVRTDSEGRFWLFDVPGLEAETRYELVLQDSRGSRLCDPWPLATFPAPGASPDTVRLLCFTCAGGHEALVRNGQRGFLPLATRRRLLRRALSFVPDVVIANGDHVYWDQRTGSDGRGSGRSRQAIALAGELDRRLPVLGSRNEAVLERAVGPQIADLYQADLRSTPVFFLQDDHDYFDGDRIRDWIVPFPPDPFMLRLSRASQHLYYPEFLPDPHRPPGLAGASAADRPPGVSECFGTLRYGRLLEALLYDCRRYMTLKGRLATFVPPEVESWLGRRSTDPTTAHAVHVPSVPVGWSAGKWGEWYPDVLAPDGTLGVARTKPMWQEGWLRQHDRLLAAASRRSGLAAFLQGDLHSIAEGEIRASGETDFRANPVRAALVGPLGTNVGWPSRGRGTFGRPSVVLDMAEEQPCLEENGFTLVDVTAEAIRLRFFKWRPSDPRTGTGGEEAIDSLEPFRVSEWARPRASRER